MSYEFCSKFHMLSSNAKCQNRLRFDKFIESIKVGTFFETQCTVYSSVEKLTDHSY